MFVLCSSCGFVLCACELGVLVNVLNRGAESSVCVCVCIHTHTPTSFVVSLYGQYFCSLGGCVCVCIYVYI